MSEHETNDKQLSVNDVQVDEQQVVMVEKHEEDDDFASDNGSEEESDDFDIDDVRDRAQKLIDQAGKLTDSTASEAKNSSKAAPPERYNIYANKVGRDESKGRFRAGGDVGSSLRSLGSSFKWGSRDASTGDDIDDDTSVERIYERNIAANRDHSPPPPMSSPTTKPSVLTQAARMISVDLEEGKKRRSSIIKTLDDMDKKQGGGRKIKMVLGLVVLAMVALIAVLAFIHFADGAKKVTTIPIPDSAPVLVVGAAQTQKDDPSSSVNGLMDIMTIDTSATTNAGANATPLPRNDRNQGSTNGIMGLRNTDNGPTGSVVVTDEKKNTGLMGLRSIDDNANNGPSSSGIMSIQDTTASNNGFPSITEIQKKESEPIGIMHLKSIGNNGPVTSGNDKISGSTSGTNGIMGIRSIDHSTVDGQSNNQGAATTATGIMGIQSVDNTKPSISATKKNDQRNDQRDYYVYDRTSQVWEFDTEIYVPTGSTSRYDETTPKNTFWWVSNVGFSGGEVGGIQFHFTDDVSSLPFDRIYESGKDSVVFEQSKYDSNGSELNVKGCVFVTEKADTLFRLLKDGIQTNNPNANLITFG